MYGGITQINTLQMQSSFRIAVSLRKLLSERKRNGKVVHHCIEGEKTFLKHRKSLSGLHNLTNLHNLPLLSLWRRVPTVASSDTEKEKKHFSWDKVSDSKYKFTSKARRKNYKIKEGDFKSPKLLCKCPTDSFLCCCIFLFSKYPFIPTYLRGR